MIQGHGDDIYEYAGDIRYNFSSNVNPAMQMPGLKEHLSDHMDMIGNYPPAAATMLERQLSMALRCRQDEVMITGGATGAIYLIAHATGSGCHSAVLSPTFSEYGDACKINGHKVSYIQSLDDVTDDMNMVWLCNPNNPTGSVVPKYDIVKCAYQHVSTVFVIDQSYEFFCLEEMMSPAEAALTKNIILLHSMTKKYAIPGLRLGFVTGDNNLIDTLRRYRMPWSVNAIALEACRYILEHRDDFCFDIRGYLDEAQRLRNALNNIRGVEVMPTHTHFMLAHIQGDAILLKRRLVDEAGILIRAAHNFAGLDRHYIRVAAQSREENDLLINTFSTIFPV